MTWFERVITVVGCAAIIALALTCSGGLLCFYLWVHIIAGWIFTTLLVVGLTVLVRR